MLTILQGDAIEQLRTLPDESVHCCVTSPPYWGLRDYGTAQWEGGGSNCDHKRDMGANGPMSGKQRTNVGSLERQYNTECPCGAKRIDSQLGLEKTPEEYVAKMVEVFREVRRVLRKDGTLWLNLGDSYVGANNTDVGGNANFGSQDGVSKASNNSKAEWRGLPPKNLVGIPWRVAFALQADGWWLRSDIIWAKPNPMPESVTDRPTKAHEYLFLLTKNSSYFYDAEAIKVPQQQCSVDRANYRLGGFAKGELNDGRVNYVNNPKTVDKTRENTLNGSLANKRSVWTVATAPFSDWTEPVHWKRVEAGARGDGTRRIVSPNSQADGGLFDLIATVLYDEHGEKSLTDICGICNRLSLEPRNGYVPSEKLRAYYFGDENLDSFLRRHLDSAIRRNNGKNKTGLFVATSLSCKPSFERSCRIGRILERHGWSEQDRDRLLSSTWPDDWPVHLWGKTLYHTGDNASCEGMYRKASEMTSHFACFPPDLIEPCIMAGTSAKGCCAKCGSPWERITESSKSFESGSGRAGNMPNGKQDLRASETNSTPDIRLGPVISSKTIGWQPTCECNEERFSEWPDSERRLQTLKNNAIQTIPCTVLDPFAGSGTTGAVALELGRKAILVELNPKYVDLIKRRTETTVGLALC